MCSVAFATISPITSVAPSSWERQPRTVLDVTGRPAEDFETIARRYAVLPRNQRTLANWLGEFAQFMARSAQPWFDLDRYDRELRRPFPSVPQFTTDSEVWRREHATAGIGKSAALRAPPRLTNAPTMETYS
jgi:hypothetical protein